MNNKIATSTATAFALSCLSYAGLGLFLTLIAEGLDNREPEPYAAYYVGAINEAISPKFWDLLVVTSLLLLCLTLPAMYLSKHKPAWLKPARYLCPATYRLLSLTFILGATAWGILAAQLILNLAGGLYPQAWGNLFLGCSGWLVLLILPFLNAAVWLVGQAVTQVANPLADKLFAHLGRYRWPAYSVFTGLVVLLIVNQQ